MLILFLFAFAIALMFIPWLFKAVIMLPHTLQYAVKDIYRYIKRKGWNYPPDGQLNAYCGLFGRGKTLSMSMVCHRLYKKYNGRIVRDRFDGKKKKINIVFLSNIDLKNVNYMPLRCLDDYPKFLELMNLYDSEHDTLTYTYLVIDEASVVLNSRNFAKNINADVLNSILTCRHYRSSMYYTSQRFSLTDKLLRDVTQDVYYCKKRWRFQLQFVYDAYELENANNPELVKPKYIKVPFVFDKDFDGYDTLACVQNLSRDMQQGAFKSSMEILQSRLGETNTELVTNGTRKLRKIRGQSRK